MLELRHFYTKNNDHITLMVEKYKSDREAWAEYCKSFEGRAYKNEELKEVKRG